MDNIIFIFKKNQRDKVEKTVALLSKLLTIEKKGELKWFLKLYIICNLSKKALWLLQKIYMMKICNNLAFSTNTSQFLATLIKILELLTTPNNENITDTSQILY